MNILKKSLFLAALLLGLVACGDDSGTGAKDDDSSSSSSVEKSSSSVVSSSSSDVISSEVERSSSSAKSSSSSSVIPDPDRGSSSSSCSVAKSSSSGDSEYDFEWNNAYAVLENPCNESNEGKVGKAWYRKDEGVFVCSYNKKDKDWEWTQVGGISSSSAKSSSSSVKVSSSSVYEPYNHYDDLAGNTHVGRDRYKQFTDSRNGRSYYYITIVGKDTNNVKDSVTVMAENLNIGKDVAGVDDQNDDSVIERYCYKDDTTYCDEYGGLYQWAEMMDLPSRCNTESCADLIKENHQGICPDGWRLFTENDFNIVAKSDDNDDGLKGLRSSAFTGSNATGFSLLGAGKRNTYSNPFEQITKAAYWFYPQEYEGDENKAYTGFVSTSSIYPDGSRTVKKNGLSVRCVKLETEPSSVSE
ncbi:major paralogous domain-containing protein [Fibrobacter sp. UWEL]|nr:major paralogous domain-containing protein [Fibrobacter sp. UWEL]